MKEHFYWIEPNVDTFYDRVVVIFLIMDTLNPATKVDAQTSKNKKNQKNSSNFNNGILEMSKCVKRTYNLIT